MDDNSKYKLILQVMKESIHKIKRVSQKLGIRIARAMDPINKDERTNTDSAERDASQVFRKMVKSENSELLISPISNKKYVKNDDKQVLLILFLLVLSSDQASAFSFGLLCIHAILCFCWDVVTCIPS